MENMRKETSFQKVCHILGPVIIYYVGYNVCYLILAAVIQLLMEKNTGVSVYLSENDVLITNFVHGCSMLCGAVWLLPMLKKECAVQNRSDRLPWLGFGILAGTAALGMNILFYLLHITELSAKYTQAAFSQQRVPLVQGLFLFGLISPFAEEVLFRGLIYVRMKKYFPVTVSIIASSVLFGVYHGNIVQTLYGFVLGLLIVWSYEKTGYFLMTVYMHGIANAVVFLITYYPDISRAVGTWVNCAIFLTTAILCIRRINNRII